MNKNYNELSVKDIEIIIRHVNITIDFLHTRHVRNEAGNKYAMLKGYKERDEFAIRTVSFDELIDVEPRRKFVDIYPKISYEVKKSWYIKNPFIFFGFVDDFGVIANINLLPIAKKAFTGLKNGDASCLTNYSNIHPIEERDQVNYIYIEEFMYPQHNARYTFGFLRYFKKMVSLLANPNNNDLVICAIGKSKSGGEQIANLGFERTGWTKGIKRNVFHPYIEAKEVELYPFYEIKWIDLQNKLLEP